MTEHVNVEEFGSVVKSAVLGEIGRQRSEALAIARLKSPKRNIKERDLVMNKLGCFLASGLLAFDEGRKLWYLRNVNLVNDIPNFDCS